MNGPRRILVATDFSPDSHVALASASAIARSLSGRVEVVYVWEPPVGLSLTDEASVRDLARKRAKLHMREFVRGAGSPPHHTRVEVGAPHELIVTLAAAGKFALIVMGAAGIGANPSRVGTVTRRVLGSAHCPVLTLRAPSTPQALPVPPRGVGA